MARPRDPDLCFTMNVVDEFELARACLAQVRKVYPSSRVVLLVDSPEAELLTRWKAELRQEAHVAIESSGEQLYALPNGGRVVEAHLRAFLESSATWWFKIDPDTFVRRRFADLPESTCFFGTVQGGKPCPSLQGGCIGGVRTAVEALERCGILSSPGLRDYARTWARGNPNLLARARDRRLVSFDFVHAWACARAQVPLVDHPEIRSNWRTAPLDGWRYAVTHPHARFDVPEERRAARMRLARLERIRELARRHVPAGCAVAVISKGDDSLVDLAGRRGLHFPQAEDGSYAGYHPADSAEAIVQLEALRSRGVEYLLVPTTSLWWLDHYAGFRGHLETRYQLVARDDESGAVYALDAGRPAAARSIGGRSR